MESQIQLSQIQMRRWVEAAIQEKYSCIGSLQQSHEKLQQTVQTMKQRIAELEKEMVFVKTVQRRQTRKTVADLLKTLRPNQSWTDYIHSWRDGIQESALERVFTASHFLETFLEELKRLQPTVFNITVVEWPLQMITPIIVIQQGKKRTGYIWDMELESWSLFQYSPHLKKLITLYIHQIRALWLQWQERHQQDMSKETDLCDKYNSYISKPVANLYQESHKFKMFHALFGPIPK